MLYRWPKQRVPFRWVPFGRCPISVATFGAHHIEAWWPSFLKQLKVCECLIADGISFCNTLSWSKWACLYQRCWLLELWIRYYACFIICCPLSKPVAAVIITPEHHLLSVLLTVNSLFSFRTTSLGESGVNILITEVSMNYLNIRQWKWSDTNENANDPFAIQCKMLSRSFLYPLIYFGYSESFLFSFSRHLLRIDNYASKNHRSALNYSAFCVLYTNVQRLMASVFPCVSVYPFACSGIHGICQQKMHYIWAS